MEGRSGSSPDTLRKCDRPVAQAATDAQAKIIHVVAVLGRGDNHHHVNEVLAKLGVHKVAFMDVGYGRTGSTVGAKYTQYQRFRKGLSLLLRTFLC